MKLGAVQWRADKLLSFPMKLPGEYLSHHLEAGKLNSLQKDAHYSVFTKARGCSMSTVVIQVNNSVLILLIMFISANAIKRLNFLLIDDIL